MISPEKWNAVRRARMPLLRAVYREEETEAGRASSLSTGMPELYKRNAGGGFHFRGQGIQRKKSKLIHLFPAVNRTKLTLFSENELFDVP